MMKFTDIIYYFYRNLLSIKYRVCLSFFIMYISVIYLAKKYVDSLPKSVEISVFDMLCDVYKGLGMVGISRYVFPIIPLFAFILISMIDFDNKTLWLIRYNSRRNIWNKQFVFTINISFLYSVIMILGGYLVSGMLIGSFNNNWTSTNGIVYKLLGEPANWHEISNSFISYKILFFIFTSNFLGLCATGLLICVVKMFLKNHYVFILLIISLFSSALLNKFSITLKQMTINLVNWMNPITIIENDIYLISLILMLYVIGHWIIGKKDIIVKI